MMKTVKTTNKDTQKIMREFTARRARQIIAVGAAVFSVLLLAVVYKRPDRFGDFSRDSLVLIQVLLIMAFLVFTVFNWRCPSCKKYLGGDVNRGACKHCGTRFR